MCKDLGGNRYECNGTYPNSGSIWGTGLYTSDSNVFQAAKHMGMFLAHFKKSMLQPVELTLGQP